MMQKKDYYNDSMERRKGLCGSWSEGEGAFTMMTCIKPRLPELALATLRVQR
jgi:hypothetical protein